MRLKEAVGWVAGAKLARATYTQLPSAGSTTHRDAQWLNHTSEMRHQLHALAGPRQLRQETAEDPQLAPREQAELQELGL